MHILESKELTKSSGKIRHQDYRAIYSKAVEVSLNGRQTGRYDVGYGSCEFSPFVSLRSFKQGVLVSKERGYHQ